MSRHHKIEFEPGEVVRPEYDPENNLVGIVVTNEGLSSLRNAVSGGKTPDERREETLSETDLGAINAHGEILREHERRITSIEERLFSPSSGGGESRERSSERD